MSPLNNIQMSKEDKSSILVSKINDKITTDVDKSYNSTICGEKNDIINMSQDQCESPMIFNKEKSNENIIKNDKEKWMEMLKKRGPRLRQNTISMANYTTEQLSAHETLIKKEGEKVKNVQVVINKQEKNDIKPNNKRVRVVTFDENQNKILYIEKRKSAEEQEKLELSNIEPILGGFNNNHEGYLDYGKTIKNIVDEKIISNIVLEKPINNTIVETNINVPSEKLTAKKVEAVKSLNKDGKQNIDATNSFKSKIFEDLNVKCPTKIILENKADKSVGIENRKTYLPVIDKSLENILLENTLKDKKYKITKIKNNFVQNRDVNNLKNHINDDAANIISPDKNIKHKVTVVASNNIFLKSSVSDNCNKDIIDDSKSDEKISLENITSIEAELPNTVTRTVKNLIDFFTNLDKKLKNNRPNVKNFQNTNPKENNIGNLIEKNGGEFVKTKNLNDRTFNFNDLLKKWNKK